MLLINTPEIDSSRYTEILVVSGDEDDLRRLHSICEGSRWKLRTVRTLKDAQEWLGRHPTPVVLCDHAIPNSGWQVLHRFATGLADRPNIVVISRLADDHLWAEVLNDGGFDLLSLPAAPKDFFRAVSRAWRDWKNRSMSHRGMAQHALRAAG